ncbi:hypothetical protein HNQ07_003085 [Deinococcus metalli]|uniref:Uncharacterized protein n=1 Tax=Deinococcus metalli TaxID=1141878 RepID=A0A7W8NQ74_9DEIO|nr:hypothetical protein [Deinococcus metalli]MBB5377586.1 hypothetical protein [Deinococcus metalli]GHF51887.1 hypothetical protein GCM10017781_30130 [Deinococcus metalli]
MNLWRWLITPDPAPGLTRTKLLKLVARVVLFAVVATLLSSLLSLTPLRPYLNTWWGSLIFILILYVPLARYMTLDTIPRTRGAAPAGKTTPAAGTSAQRRRERNRYAGVRKGPPKYGGRR